MSAGGLAARYEPAAGVLSRKVGDETVLVDLNGELYFSLNRSGSLAWDELVAGATVDAAVAAIVDAFEVDPPVAANDLAELVTELVAAGLLNAH